MMSPPIHPLAVMLALVSSNILLTSGPTWLTDRVGVSHSQLLSGPLFSQVNSCPWAQKLVTGSFLIREKLALPGSHRLLHAVPKAWWSMNRAIGIANARRIQLYRPMSMAGV